MYKIILTDYFKKQLKKLAKKDFKLKYLLKYELLNFCKTKAIPIGKHIFKLRLKSQSSGKSGGYRLYLFLLEVEGILAPLCMYKKSEKGNISEKELLWHLNQTKQELQKWLN